LKTGRPPIPTRVKALRGTLKPSRRNLKEPEPTPGLPAVPIVLPPCAKPLGDWLTRELASLRTITVSDGPALLLTSVRLRDYLELEKFVAEHGRMVTVTMTNGTERQTLRPEVGLMAAAWRDVLAALQQLGLTPSARSRVSVTRHEPEDELEAIIGPRRFAK
jgi:P27 family predicted phage terminase small subunit